MEELRSTEILDKEIEADARKKAEKILANAADECEKILASVDDRVKDTFEKKSEYYKSKINQLEKNTDASLPLEKERFLVSFYASSVSDAFNEYLQKIGSEKRLELIEKKLIDVQKNTFETRFSVSVFGFSSDSVKKLLEKHHISVVSVNETTFEKSGETAAYGNTVHEGLILDSEDKKVRIRLTIDQIVREIKDTYSYKLASTLFGGNLPS